MEVQKYIDQKKEFYNLFLSYLEKESDDDENLEIYDYIKSHQIDTNKGDFYELIRLISKISKNHYPTPQLFSRIEQILIRYEGQIKETFTNFDIFNIFKNVKRVLLFLIQRQILELDETVLESITNKSDKNGTKYRHYFYPEIKKYASNNTSLNSMISHELLSLDKEDISNFEEKRKKFENHTYISTLIRNDSIEEFVAYLNENNIDYQNYKIKPSIYETNSFLLKNNPTLIEYASFFGSIQIFNYLRTNNVEITPSLWLYAIHASNAEIIQFLEDNYKSSQFENYKEYIIESIKCHHNNITDYIKENLAKQKMLDKMKNTFLWVSFRYSNYEYFDYNYKLLLYYACKYNYYDLAKLIFEVKKYDVNKPFILKIKLLLM